MAEHSQNADELKAVWQCVPEIRRMS
jgi:hypothetical protein